MKRIVTILLSLICFSGMAQVKTYFSTSGEMIFSFAQIKSNGVEKSPELRWSPVFNGQGLINHDLGRHVGLFYGLAYRNVGFIYKPTADTLKKFRTYNLGIPIGIKIGNLDGLFLFGGYEFEIPYSYKEKTFVNEDKKTVESEWFSPKVNPFVQSVFVGINFPKGLGVKVKYYLDPFFKSGYSEVVGGVTVKPYANMNVHVFYISLDWNIFKDTKEYKYKWKGKRKNRQATETAI